MTRLALDLPAPPDDAPRGARSFGAETGAVTNLENGAEGALVDAARTDPDAFAALYRKHFGAIAGYLFRRTGDAHLAEDLAAETFIAAWRAMPRYQRTRAPFRAWLLRIATNQANAAARSARPRRAAEARAASERPSAHTAASEHDRSQDAARDLVHAALDALAPRHRDVIALVHFESLSLAQAAQVLGVREGTVKSRLSRARAALKVEITRLGGTP